MRQLGGQYFDALLAPILERIRKLVADLIINKARDAYAAGLRQCLQPRGDVDAIAVDIVAIGDHVAEIDPDPERNAFALGHIGIAVDHCALHLDGAAHSIDDAPEFHEHAVTGGLDDAAAVLLDLRIDEFAAMRLEAIERAFLVRSHQPRVARHIGGEDRGETAFDGLFHSSPSRTEYSTTVIAGTQEKHRTARRGALSVFAADQIMSFKQVGRVHS